MECRLQSEVVAFNRADAKTTWRGHTGPSVLLKPGRRCYPDLGWGVGIYIRGGWCSATNGSAAVSCTAKRRSAVHDCIIGSQKGVMRSIVTGRQWFRAYMSELPVWVRKGIFVCRLCFWECCHLLRNKGPKTQDLELTFRPS